MEKAVALLHRERNTRLIDLWSLVHFTTSFTLVLLFDPIIALVITTVWEPLEIFVISPLVAKIGVDFGYEGLQNSLSDLIFNSLGILTALLFLN